MSKAILTVDVVYTYVDTEDSHVHDIIYDTLKARVKGYQWSKAYKSGAWDGYKRFYDRWRNRFLTGFITKVNEVLSDNEVEVTVVNGDKVFGGLKIDIDAIELNGIDSVRWKETQLPVLKQMLSVKRCALRMGTGGGKTEVIAGLLKALENEKALVMVHRIELLDQMANRLEMRLQEPVGRISAGTVDLSKRITVGMIQSVWAKRPILANWLRNEVGVLVIDECHHSGAKTWASIAMSCNAVWRYGVSGTPITYTDDKDMWLVGLTGEIVKGFGVKELVEKGYAVKPVVNMLVVPVAFTGSWVKVFEEVFGENETMVEALKGVIRSELEAGKDGILIFVDRIRHGERILDELLNEGWRADFVHGSRSEEDRVGIVEGMKAKKYDVVIATTVFDEGIDVSGIGSVVFWCSSKSVVRILQRIGRGVRIEDGKDTVHIWDFVVDNKYMKSHMKRRVKYYYEEGIECRFLAWSDRGIKAVEV
jgi:superfamily II DNA or RNA helicase